MKIQEFKTSKFYGFGALVPQDAIETYPNKPSVVLFKDNDLVYFPKEGDGKLIYRLGKGEFKIIGIQTEITEEQAKEIVDDYRGTKMFHNYLFNGSNHHFVAFNTAIESFNSLMQKLEMYSENPYREKLYCDLDTAIDLGGRLEQWQQAQYRTGKWLIIQKIR